MTAHLSQRQLEEYRSGGLAPPDLLAADDHLSGCDECRARLVAGAPPIADAVASLRDQLGRAPDEDHLTYEELEAFVDGGADPTTREVVRDHVEVCATCAAELEALAAVAAELRGEAPSGTSSVAARTPVTTIVGRRGQRDAAPPRPGRRILFAAAAAVGALIATAALLYLIRTEPTRVATARPVEGSRPGAATEPTRSAPAAAQPASPELATVALADAGAVVGLDRDGNVVGLAPDDPERELVRSALASGRPEVDSRVSDLRGETGTLLSGDAAAPTFALDAPLGTAVANDRPTFRWHPAKPGAQYRVEVYGAAFEPVTSSPTLDSTSWTCDRALPRGATYSWQVIATVGDQEIRSPAPPSPEARFLVLDAGTANALDAAVARRGASPLVRGLLYARAGLIDEAETELRAVERANPGSPVAASLLRGLRAAPSR